MKGSCFCGEVAFSASSEFAAVVNCHCDFCRSHSGAAFSTYAVVKESDLTISKGEEKLTRFVIAEGEKSFCRECGTPIFNLNHKYPGLRMLYLGTLKERNAIQPNLNIWCESQLEWVTSIANIPSRPHDAVNNQKIPPR